MVSIRDVARIAKVSPSTVSRVINGTARVDDEKRKRVEKVILETGFEPNEVARSLYKRSSKIIGILVPNIINPFFNELAGAVEEKCDEKGFRLTLCNSNDDVEKERRNLKLLERMNADGVILMTNMAGVREEVARCRIPVVMIDRQIERGGGIGCIRSDHYQGGRMAMEHLLESGCRKVVQMCGPQRFSSARQRHRGYLDVCKERGVEPAWMECGYSYEAGLVTARELLERFPDTDGVIAANDMVAVSVYKTLHKRGMKVPEDVQVIGFDDVTLSRMFTPEITTIAQPITQMGHAAVNMLADYVSGKEIEHDKVFRVKLVQRETTKGRPVQIG